MSLMTTTNRRHRSDRYADAADDCPATTKTADHHHGPHPDHHHHRHHQYQHRNQNHHDNGHRHRATHVGSSLQCGTMTVDGDHWPVDDARPPRRPNNNKKYANFRRFGDGHRQQIVDADNGTVSTPSTSRYHEPFRQAGETADASCAETIQWEDMAKHFARLPPIINDNNKADNFQNGYRQANLPQNHHLQYYSDLHKLHQVAYANRNQIIRKPQQQPLRQPCCKPWQWTPHGGPAGTFMNAYYLSEPKRYTMHATNVIQEDSLVEIDGADQLSMSVWFKYLENRQSESVYDMKMAMWCKLFEMIKSRAPGCGLYLVGSTMNGFGVDVSDADFCLLTGCTAAVAANRGSRITGGADGQQHDWTVASTVDEQHRVCGVDRLQWLMGLLEHEQINGNINTTDTHIVYAKVPILRFRWADSPGSEKIDVDLCCNNVVGIRNTHLLYCYSRLDYRVRPLVLTIKLWASCHNINDPKKMTLSSYSLVLMVINFLQCIQPPVLPSLQCIYGLKFSTETNIEYVHMHEQLSSSGWKSANQQNLGELLLQFFKYYNDFNYCKFALSVRMGRVIPLERCRMAETIKNDPGQWKFIGIEEPFERTNTARSVHNHNVFAQIKDTINKSYNMLKETKSLDSIFSEFEK